MSRTAYQASQKMNPITDCRNSDQGNTGHRSSDQGKKLIMRIFLAASCLSLAMPAHAQMDRSQNAPEPFTTQTLPDLAPQQNSAPAGSPSSSQARAGAAALGADSFEAVTLRLTRIEQLLRAQQNMQNADVLAALEQILNRLDALEKTAPQVSMGSDQLAAGAGTFDQQQAADLRLRLSALEEASRQIRGQTDQILRLLESMDEKTARANADAEFRFQALEGKMRQQENAGSVEPVVIGTVAPSATISGETDVMPRSGPLVGESAEDISKAQNEARLEPEKLADPDKLYDRGLALLRDGKYAAAREDFKQILANYSQHARAGNAQYWLGESYYVERDYKNAAAAFLAGYTTYEKSGKAPDSLLKLGMSLVALDEKKTACDAFGELSVKFPNASSAIQKRAEIEKNRAGCS